MSRGGAAPLPPADHDNRATRIGAAFTLGAWF
jgi:hypothetical protein